MSLPWTCSGGGPVIAIPKSLAAAWRGTTPPVGVEVPEGWRWGSGDIECDYDRACDTQKVRDYAFTAGGGVGWLPVADGAAVILDAELMTAWLPDAEGGYIIRNYTEQDLDDEAARAYVKEAEAGEWRTLSLSWTIEGGLYMFDSAYPGAAEAADIEAADGVADCEIPDGTYRVDVGSTPDEADIIRLRRV